MKIASYNANGIRARLETVLYWLDKCSPDILCLQETKVQDPDFPLKPFEDAGYCCSFKGQKKYNGVAVLSKTEPLDVRFGFGDNDQLEEPRLITLAFEGVTVVNTYVPQGQSPDSEKFNYKLAWLERLEAYFGSVFTSSDALIWTGDFNVAPEPLDVYDPDNLLGSIGYHPREHQALQRIKAWGFVDVYREHHPEEKSFTFWDYRIPNAAKRGLGWRIDHIWATPCLAEKSTDAWIDVDMRLRTKPSDHTFIVAGFNI